MVSIKVENLSKAYQLGEIGTGTLGNDLTRWFAKVRGREDPFLKIDETNNRRVMRKNDLVWSLKNINFEIKEGDAVGIIGRNGAGKSTLLKILSKVTSPTTGSIKIKGRIASLLEVGTGFHPELSGRENIYLNGAILGMRKKEIALKFNEIVDFSGVERYIDTPVKRYSSGMYVRLAFAVAAYLESEILIVDEVLAVGDYEFQKKCLGKMQEVSRGEGRTVLFVSHNMGSITGLCNKGILLKNGTLQKTGEIAEITNLYVNDRYILGERFHVEFPCQVRKQAYILELSLSNSKGQIKGDFDVFDQIFLDAKYYVNESIMGFSPVLALKQDGILQFYSLLSDLFEDVLEKQEAGLHHYKIKLPYPLKKGRYSITFRLGKLRVADIDFVEDALVFNVDEISFDPTNKSYASFRPGNIVCILDWQKL